MFLLWWDFSFSEITFHNGKNTEQKLNFMCTSNSIKGLFYKREVTLGRNLELC